MIWKNLGFKEITCNFKHRVPKGRKRQHIVEFDLFCHYQRLTIGQKCAQNPINRILANTYHSNCLLHTNLDEIKTFAAYRTEFCYFRSKSRWFLALHSFAFLFIYLILSLISFLLSFLLLCPSLSLLPPSFPYSPHLNLFQLPLLCLSSAFFSYLNCTQR